MKFAFKVLGITLLILLAALGILLYQFRGLRKDFDLFKHRHRHRHALL